MCGERTRSMRRGSTTMSFAPWRSRCYILDGVDLFVGAPRRGDRADRPRAVPLPDLKHPARDGADRLIPLDLAPRVGDLLANHGPQHAVRVGRVPEGEPSLH